MKKQLLSICFCLIFIPTSIIAQSQFENAGFEEWESITDTDVPEPVNWSSLKTSDNQLASQAAPIV